jgi:8-oxo-dGTP diphosphatase
VRRHANSIDSFSRLSTREHSYEQEYIAEFVKLEGMQDTYIPPTLTVDSVVMQLLGDKLGVLLIKRAREPFKGSWALPGGYNPAGETTLQAMTRILRSKAGLNSGDLSYIEQLYTFDTVARDPRGHAVSVVYMGLGKDIVLESSLRDVEEPAFFALDELPALAYDHGDIIGYALKRLRDKVTYTNAISALLPEYFTLSQAQAAYEAVLGMPLDKRNFRKKFLAFDFVEATGEYSKDGPHRPAQIYRFSRSYAEDQSFSFE